MPRNSYYVVYNLDKQSGMSVVPNSVDPFMESTAFLGLVGLPLCFRAVSVGGMRSLEGNSFVHSFLRL